MKSGDKTTSHFLVVCVALLGSVLLGNVWGIHFLLTPVREFTVAVHELGHAVSCWLTGGWVSGLTIVDDAEGHGGLTFTHGGIPWIVAQMGYVGTTLFGCALLELSRSARIARAILFLLGVAMAGCALVVMPGDIVEHGRFAQGFGSIAWALVLGGGLVYGSIKLGETAAQTVVVIIAAQTALSAVTSTWNLMLASFSGMSVWSDASNMAALTGVPTVVWSLGWAAFSIGLLAVTLRSMYRSERVVPGTPM